jgi:protease-4
MKGFLKQTIASLLGTILGLAIFTGAGFIGLLGLVAFLSTLAEAPTQPILKGRSMLSLDLSMTVRDEPGYREDSIDRWLSSRPRPVPLRVLLDTIQHAAKDKSIVGLYLHDRQGTGPTVGLAGLREIRNAIAQFRQSGKPVIAYGTDWDERAYYLASAASETRLHPAGGLELNGLAAETAFWGGTFEKYGVGMQFVRVGKFKSAVEPLSRKDFSPENRAQMTALLQDLWQSMLEPIAASRKTTIAQLQTIADQGGLLRAEQAVKLGLVDRIAYEDQAIERILKIAERDEERHSFRQISIAEYAQQVDTQNAAKSKLGNRRKDLTGNKIALLYATGTIVDSNTDGDPDQISGRALAAELRRLRQDDDVKAIVLRIDSPGGSATAAEVISREVELAVKAKPLIVSMGEVAASGGYWIAAPATEIFAESGTITGSIGVFGLLPNIQKLGENNGVTWDSVTTAPFANISSIGRPKSPQELALLQQSVDWIYDRFLDHVAKSRSLDRAKVADLAQGRVWSGQAAQRLGLVDQLGGLDAALAAAAKAAKIGRDWALVEYPDRDFFGLEWVETKTQLLWTRLGWHQTPILARSLADLQSQAWLIDGDPRSVYAWWPNRLQID